MFDWLRRARDPIRFYSSKTLEYIARGSSDYADQTMDHLITQEEGINAGFVGSQTISNDLEQRVEYHIRLQARLARVKRIVRR